MKVGKGAGMFLSSSSGPDEMRQNLGRMGYWVVGFAYRLAYVKIK